MPRKHKSSGPAAPGPLAGPQRLNKLLAAAGLGSRREVEQYILEGRIEIDGEAVTDLATKVDPEHAKLTFDGSLLKIFRPVYFALNKPVGVLSTNRDPSGRMRAIDLVNVKERIFSAGRLDRSSEGLMLLTNDGELAQRLSHPRYGIQKIYLATVQGEVTQADLEKLIRGVRLAEGYAKVDAVKLRKQRSGAADLEIALSEGKNREIRRILARLGHKVVALKRLAIGPLKLGQLPAGGWRPLTKFEIQALYAAALTGRRKKRGTGKPLRGKPRAGAADESGEPAMAAGQFDRYGDDDFDDNYGPSLDETSDDGDDEYIVVGDASPKGSVIPYDDDDVEDDGGSMMFDDEDADEDSDDDADEEAPVRRGRPAVRGPKPTGSSGRSPNDLRSRKRASGGEGPSSRTGYKAGSKSGGYKSSGYKGSKAPRPASGGGSGGGGARGAKKSFARSGSRPTDASRQSSYSRPDASGEGRSSTRPASRPTSRPTGGRSTGRPTGRPTSGPGKSAPRKGGPGRSGPGRSGPSSGSGGAKGGPRSGPGRSGPPRGKGGPGKRGPGGPGRGKR